MDPRWRVSGRGELAGDADRRLRGRPPAPPRLRLPFFDLGGSIVWRGREMEEGVEMNRMRWG